MIFQMQTVTQTPSTTRDPRTAYLVHFALRSGNNSPGLILECSWLWSSLVRHNWFPSVSQKTGHKLWSGKRYESRRKLFPHNYSKMSEQSNCHYDAMRRTCIELWIREQNAVRYGEMIYLCITLLRCMITYHCMVSNPQWIRLAVLARQISTGSQALLKFWLWGVLMHNWLWIVNGPLITHCCPCNNFMGRSYNCWNRMGTTLRDKSDHSKQNPKTHTIQMKCRCLGKSKTAVKCVPGWKGHREQGTFAMWHYAFETSTCMSGSLSDRIPNHRESVGFSWLIPSCVGNASWMAENP